MADPPAKKARVEGVKWDHECQQVVRFRLLESASAEELKKEIAEGGIEFDGEFFHQHFGEDEQIKGYKDLAVNVWMSARTFHTWLDIKFTMKKMGADKIEKIMREHLPQGFVKTQQEFIDAVVEGVKEMPDLSEAGLRRETIELEGDSRVYIQQVNLATCHKAIQDMHARFEPLLLFFIDGASLIEKGDDKWEALLAVQPAKGGGHLLLGATMLYNFWAYPDTMRLRLSQILVLPPYRDVGLGKAMLQASYAMARDKGCVDLTVEDPTPNLQRVREKMEVETLLALPWVVAAAKECERAALAGETRWPAAASAGIPAPNSSTATASAEAAGAVEAEEGPVQGSSHNDENVDSQNIGAGGAGGAGAGLAPMDVDASKAAAGEAKSKEEKPAGVPPTVCKEAVQQRQERAAAAGAAAAAKEAAAGPSAGAPLAPPAVFLEAIRQETKIYTKEARCVWEALLYVVCSGLRSAKEGKAALDTLVRTRLEAAQFAHCGAESTRKAVVATRGEHKLDFLMMRMKQQAQGAGAGTSAAAEAGTSSTSAEGAAAPAPGGPENIAQGRLNIVTITAEEKEAKMGELMEERWGQLDMLHRLLKKSPVLASAGAKA